MAMPTPTGELIGQQITVNCTEQVDDLYLGQLQVDLSTEYDLTKGVDITFDGQLYKNVPVTHLTDEAALIIGELSDNDQPVLDKYPFCIALILKQP